MSEPPRQHPMAAAMHWVSRIVAAAMMMVLPGLVGQWLDDRVGTSFLALVGFACGLILSMFYLIAITKRDPGKRGGDYRGKDK